MWLAVGVALLFGATCAADAAVTGGVGARWYLGDQGGGGGFVVGRTWSAAAVPFAGSVVRAGPRRMEVRARSKFEWASHAKEDVAKDQCSAEPTCTRCTTQEDCGDAGYECLMFQYHSLGYCATRCSGPGDQKCPCGGSCVALQGRDRGNKMYYCLKPNGRFWCDSIYQSYGPSQLGAFMSTFFVVVCAASVLWMVLSQCAEGHAAVMRNHRRGEELRRRRASAIRGNPQRIVGSHGTGRTPNSRGHSREEIARLPVERLTATDVPAPGESIDEDEMDLYTCAVCLDEFAAGDRITRLPCIHRYHAECIGKWLANSSLCPVCKQNAFGDPKDIVQPKNAAAKLRERALARKRLAAAQGHTSGEGASGEAGSTSTSSPSLGSRIRQFFTWTPSPQGRQQISAAPAEGDERSGGAPAAEESNGQELALIICQDGGGGGEGGHNCAQSSPRRGCTPPLTEQIPAIENGPSATDAVLIVTESTSSRGGGGARFALQSSSESDTDGEYTGSGGTR